MSYSALNAVDESKITRLGFKAEPCNYVYTTPSEEIERGTIYEVEESTYEKVKEIMIGNSAHSISKGDKVYVLPGHPLSMQRIQEYLKRIGANITKNVSIATIIAGTEDFCTSVGKNDQAKFLHMMIKWRSGYELVKNIPNEFDVAEMRLNLSEETGYNEEYPTYISGLTGRYCYNVNINLFGRDVYFMTPQAIDVLYNVLSRKLKVVTSETICDDANSELKLVDKETYFSISNMLNSGDNANVKLGLSILFHCDLRGEIRYIIWKLSTAYRNIVSYADKSKSRDYFLERTNWNHYSHLDKEDFMNEAYDNNFMTQEILDDLLPLIQEEHTNDCINHLDEDFYEHEKLENGDIIIKLKEKWKSVKPIKIEEDGLILT